MRLCRNQDHRLVRDMDESKGYRCLDCSLTIPTSLVRNFTAALYGGLHAFRMETRIVRAAERDWAIKELES